MRAPEAEPEQATIPKGAGGVRYIAIPAVEPPQDFSAELVSEAEIVKYLAAARQAVAPIQEEI